MILSAQGILSLVSIVYLILTVSRYSHIYHLIAFETAQEKRIGSVDPCSFTETGVAEY